MRLRFRETSRVVELHREPRLNAIRVRKMRERSLIERDGPREQPGRMQPVRLLRLANRTHHSAKKFRLRRIAPRRSNLRQHTIDAHPVTVRLLAVRRIDRDRRARRRLRLL
jgi:hypothetical protein